MATGEGGAERAYTTKPPGRSRRFSGRTLDQAGTGGTLSVTDGVHTANITLLGQYDPAGFQTEADKNTGTLISYHDHLA